MVMSHFMSFQANSRVMFNLPHCFRETSFLDWFAIFVFVRPIGNDFIGEQEGSGREKVLSEEYAP